MHWYDYPACFVGGAGLANFVPHFVAGVSGLRLPTPFATPPFRGLSSPTVNVLWAACNLGLAYGLLVHVVAIDLARPLHAGIAATGFLLAAIGLARKLERFRRLSTNA